MPSARTFALSMYAALQSCPRLFMCTALTSPTCRPPLLQFTAEDSEYSEYYGYKTLFSTIVGAIFLALGGFALLFAFTAGVSYTDPYDVHPMDRSSW